MIFVLSESSTRDVEDESRLEYKTLVRIRGTNRDRDRGLTGVVDDSEGATGCDGTVPDIEGRTTSCEVDIDGRIRGVDVGAGGRLDQG